MAANHVFGMSSNVSEGDDILMMGDHEEMHNQSGSEDAENNSTENQTLKRKRYHRHTPYQIQEMEAFFKDCPHPDNKQRKELSEKLGMELLQVKFWFQNRRTQMKTKHDRQENAQLRAENDKLRAENMRYREALINASCPTCGGMVAVGDMSPYERHLRMENARLREEIDCISAKAAKYVGKPFTSSSAAPSSSVPRSIDKGRSAAFFEGRTSNGEGYSGAKDFDKKKNN